MATASDIAEVRQNTNEVGSDTFTDDFISALIDINGVAGASAELWRKKAASWADQVNTTEAGASRSLSDLSKNAKAMAEMWQGRVPVADDVVSDRPVSRRIVR